MESNGNTETERLYYADAYINSFDATVICCEGDGKYETVLERTAFYPEGGGQPSDLGQINGVPVLDVRENGECVIHVTDRGFTPGERVKCEIDWAHRFRLMQHHSGEHIISGLAKRMYGLDNVGFHMGSDCVTLDLNGPLGQAELWALECAANEAVYRNLPIETAFPGAKELDELEYRSKKRLEGKVRIVKVPGYDTCACCGLHVAATGEIGIIKLVSAQSYKGGIRLQMLCGSDALADYHRKNRSIHEISALLSAKAIEVVDATSVLRDENAALKGQIWQLRGQLYELKAKGFGAADKLCLFEDNLDSSELKRFCAALCGESGGAAAVFSGDDTNGYRYAINGADAAGVAKELNAVLSARGGGAKGLAQGHVPAAAYDIVKFFTARGWQARS